MVSRGGGGEGVQMEGEVGMEELFYRLISSFSSMNTILTRFHC
jgi:hypothetical protein